MTEHIRISAVIPTYNRGHIVGRAIESALAQEYAPSEVIIIDDGSNDRTLQVVETYGHRVRYVHQANAGVSASRNRGIREAEFEWIAFLDSDDYWLPGHLKRMAAAIEVQEFAEAGAGLAPAAVAPPGATLGHQAGLLQASLTKLYE